MKTLTALAILMAVAGYFSVALSFGILLGAAFTLGSIVYHSFTCKTL